MIEPHKKHTLGNRAFLFFLSRRLKPVFILLIFAAGVWSSERWAAPYYVPWVDYIARLGLLLACACLLLMLVQAWLEYRFYTYTFTDEAFIMTSGYILRNEIAALYHQIQNVNIVRSPLDRMAGVSQIVIFMTGGERYSARNRIVLPAVGRTRAKLVQKELLVRARRHVPAAV